MKYQRHEEGIQQFGRNVRRIREKKKLSQEELAYKTDMELSQIGRIERGEINTSISSVYIIAEALKVSPAEFFKKK